MQGSGGTGFFIAQFRQMEPGDGLVLRHLGLRLRALGDDGGHLVQRSGRFRLGVFRVRPLDVIEHGIAGADIGGELLEAGRLTGLTLQALDLAFELCRHVVEAFEIGFGGAQPKFRLVAARMQAGNPGGLFQQLPARLGLGLNEFADAPLPHHGGRARAGRGIGKEKLHILGAGFLAVDAIDRTLLALDAARHLDLVGIVEGAGAVRSELSR